MTESIHSVWSRVDEVKVEHWKGWTIGKTVVIDPGEHSGVCVIGSNGSGNVSVGELNCGVGWVGEMQHSRELADLVCGKINLGVGDKGASGDLGKCVSLVVEDFILVGGSMKGGGANSNRNGLTPVRITSGLFGELRSRGWHGTVRMQPASSKTVVNDERLRALGMWVKGSDHIRDSLRHAEVYRRSGQAVSFRI